MSGPPSFEVVMAVRYYVGCSGLGSYRVSDSPKFSSISSAIAFVKLHATINDRGRGFGVVYRLSDNDIVAEFTYYNSRWHRVF